jgi:hypothetical protein
VKTAVAGARLQMIDDDPDIEKSPLSGKVTRDGVIVSVEIYPLAEGEEGWSLSSSMAARSSGKIGLLTNSDAYAEFYQTEGTKSFLEQQPGSAKH